MNKYILLMRHGKVRRTSDIPDEKQPLLDHGKEVVEVVQAATEHLLFLPEDQKINIGKIWTGYYLHAVQTARIFAKALTDRELPSSSPEKQKFLSPPDFSKAKTKNERMEVGGKILKALDEISNDSTEPSKNAILVVGHGPQIGWIAQTILKKGTPTARAELLCIEIHENKARLLWTMSPTDDETFTEIKGKIEVKKKLAEALGGLLIALLSFLLGLFLDSGAMKDISPTAKYYLYGSAVVMFVGLGLYGLTMFSYDKLLMPKRFWADVMEETKKDWIVKRPPSPAVWVLYQNMVHIWEWMFTPASVLVFIGLLLLAGAVAEELTKGLPVLIILLAAVVLIGGLYAYYKWQGPILGVED